MKRARTMTALLLGLTLCLTAALASGGDAGDPLVSLSYLEGLFSRSLDQSVESRLNGADDEVRATAAQRLEVMEANLLSGAGQTAAAAREETLKCGDVLAGSTGLVVIPLAGEVRLELTGGAVVDVTEGREVFSGQVLTAGHRYIAAENAAAAFTVDSPTAVVSYEGSCALSLSTTSPNYYAIACALRELDLFRGSNSGIGEGFDLHRAPSRGEGLVMFIRILGEEGDALSCAYAHPFTDVPAWLDRYVAWAYHQGYANGVAPTRFGVDSPLSAVQYEEFLLRALGYSVAGVHDYSTSLERGLDCGALTNGEFELLREGTFLRSHVAYLSYYALDTVISGSRQTLGQRLEERRVITAGELREARALVDSSRIY